MTSSAVRSSAGSRSNGGEEAMDISCILKVNGFAASLFEVEDISKTLVDDTEGRL